MQTVPVKSLPGSHRVPGPQLTKDNLLTMSVISLIVETHSPSQNEAIPPFMWSFDRLRSNELLVQKPPHPPEQIYSYTLAGRTDEGRSVALTGAFRPWIVIELALQKSMPAAVAACPHATALYLGKIANKVQAQLQQCVLKRRTSRPGIKGKRSRQEFDCDVTVEFHKRARGFHSVGGEVVLVPFAFCSFSCRTDLEDSQEVIYFETDTRSSPFYGCRLAEVAASTTLQLLEATGINPGTRVDVDVRQLDFPTHFHFTTDIEATVLPTVTRRSLQPPVFRLAADQVTIPAVVLAVFDFETCGASGFAKAAKDPIICIGVVIDSPFTGRHGYVLTLPDVSATPSRIEQENKELDFTLVVCKSELHMLEQFRDLLHVDFDVDMVTHWNGFGYDFPYLRDRLRALNVLERGSRATLLSRKLRVPCKFKEKKSSSAAHGERVSVVPVSPLVVHFDLMVLIAKRFKFDQYTLSHVATELLGKGKVDLPYEEMFAHWRSGDASRRREVAAYCFGDVLLPLEIWRKLLLHSQVVALSRVCTITLEEALTRGELMKSFALLFVFAHKRGYVLNENPEQRKLPTWQIKQAAEARQAVYHNQCKKRKATIKAALDKARASIRTLKPSALNYCKEERTYQLEERARLTLELKEATELLEAAEKGQTQEEARAAREARRLMEDGATVLEPKTGLWGFVATLDFEALYPSIIIENNLCPSTFLGTQDPGPIEGHVVKAIPLGNEEYGYFVQSVPGLLPTICINLLNERKRAKREKAAADAAGDTGLAEVKDGEQLALKVVCNSQYGAQGAPDDKAPYNCVHVARAVTGRGRELLEQTRDKVEEDSELEVIYGDTDSVLPCYDRKFLDLSGEERVERIRQHAGNLANEVSDYFGRPIHLEFEKLYQGFFLVSKKRYFGKVNGKIYSKGVASVRRSSPKEQVVLHNALQTIFIDHPHDQDMAYEEVHAYLQRLVQGKTSVFDFQRTCKLKAKYSAPYPQSIVRDKIKQRRPGTEPQPGDRVAYALQRLPREKATQNEMAEDPVYMHEHGLPVALHHYLKSWRTSVEDLFRIAGKDMKRVELLWDQAIEIARQQKFFAGAETAIRHYRTAEELAAAPLSEREKSAARADKAVQRKRKQGEEKEEQKKQQHALRTFLKLPELKEEEPVATVKTKALTKTLAVKRQREKRERDEDQRKEHAKIRRLFKLPSVVSKQKKGAEGKEVERKQPEKSKFGATAKGNLAKFFLPLRSEQKMAD